MAEYFRWDKVKAKLLVEPCPDCIGQFLPEGQLFGIKSYDRDEWRQRVNTVYPHYGDKDCKRCMKRRYVYVLEEDK